MLRLLMCACCVVVLVLCSPVLSGEDWPMWGGTNERNMVSSAKGLPVTFDCGTSRRDGKGVDMSTTKNVKWAVELGSHTYGNSTISGGKVIVGINDAGLKDSRLTRTRGGMILCLDEATGKKLWQLVIPRFRTTNKQFNYDHLNLGMCASATIVGDRAYVISSRGEVLCLDMNGLADGNDGEFKDEGQYMAGIGKKPITLDPKIDADIIWSYDMVKELPVWPQDASSGAVLVLGDLVYAATSNAVDRSHVKVPYPDAPSLIALDRKTGRLVAGDGEKIGRRMLHGQWSSPMLCKVGGKELIVYGAGDGFCYAFAPVKRRTDGKTATLEKIWGCDVVPKEYRVKDGKKIPYQKRHYKFDAKYWGVGPAEIIATPVFYKGRIYVNIGQDPLHGRGDGALTCMDAATGKILWQSKEVHRSLATVSIADDLLYVADYSGQVHCFDAISGKRHWMYETKEPMWSSTFVVDGRLYVGSDGRHLWVFETGKQAKVIAKSRLRAKMANTPVVANGVMYVATDKYLYALQSDGAAKGK